jgi:transposase
MVAEVRPHYGSEYEGDPRGRGQVGIGTPESLRKWIRQSQVDAGQRPGVTTEESVEIRRLRRENAELRRANENLKAASTFFASVPSLH